MLHREPRGSGSFDPASFERLCAEDPSSARDALMRDQRDLLDEFERTYALHRAKVADLVARAEGMPATDIRREAAALRESQDAIRRILRRIDASAQSASDLMAELREWEAREGEDGTRHADHPDVRAEIIRSELRSRGHQTDLQATPIEESPFGRLGCAISEPHVVTAFSVAPPSEDAFDRDADMGEMTSCDTETLIRLIRETTREAERWHGQPEQDHEVVDDLRRLRDLHAILKRLDREGGATRDRMTLAVRMR